MSGKLEFGIDYLWIMRNLVHIGSDGESVDNAADALARFFMFQWGFDIEEIDRVNEIFWDRFSNEKLENDLTIVAKRIAEHIKDDKESIKRFVIGMAAIGAMDLKMTEKEMEYLQWFQAIFDLRPSEFIDLCTMGEQWAYGLNFFADEYAKSRYGVKVE